jgi:hypothetical protein
MPDDNTLHTERRENLKFHKSLVIEHVSRSVNKPEQYGTKDLITAQIAALWWHSDTGLHERRQTLQGGGK